jgi:hypothetical protein
MAIETNLSGKDLNRRQQSGNAHTLRKRHRHRRSEVERLWQSLQSDRDRDNWAPPILLQNPAPPDAAHHKPLTSEEIIELHQQAFAPDVMKVTALRGLIACAIVLLVALLLLTGEDDPREPHHSEVLEHLGLQIEPP